MLTEMEEDEYLNDKNRFEIVIMNILTSHPVGGDDLLLFGGMPCVLVKVGTQFVFGFKFSRTYFINGVG